MNPIDNKIHGILDYVTVVIFLLAPLLFGFEGMAAILSYLIAVIHLVMTLLTDFELGYLDMIKTSYHKLVEFAVIPLLIIIGASFAVENLANPAVFYILMAAIIMVVAILSQYTEVMKVEQSKEMDGTTTA